MTKEQLLNWIEEHEEKIKEEIDWLFEEYDFEEFFDEIEELKLEDSEENLVKKIAKLLSIYILI